MQKNLLLLLLVCGAVSSSITCPDRQKTCPDKQTCCLTDHGYKCCPYPNAVCCADQAHCCPFGFICDLTTQMCERSWVNLLLPRDEAPLAVKQTPLQTAPPSVDQAPPSVDQAPPSVVYCDNVYTCPNGYTCCRYPAGGWWCCPSSPGRCCRDGYHCCPYGYDCDATYTHCIRQGVPHPFARPFSRPSAIAANPVDVLHQVSAASTQPAEQTLAALGEEPVVQGGEVIHCDAQFYCPKGSSCCRDQDQNWSCCPYPLGVCCADGRHCCQYGYTCDPSYSMCRKMPLTL